MDGIEHRSPWYQLSARQMQELDDELQEALGLHGDRLTAMIQLRDKYARRTVALLVSNDLRGAMYAAEVADSVDAMMDGRYQARLELGGAISRRVGVDDRQGRKARSVRRVG